MGFFGRKKDDYQEAFNQMNQQKPLQTAQERIYFEQCTDPNDATKYADLIMKGTPICIDFSQIEVDEANKIIAFLTGYLYAIGGEAKRVQNKAFLFARKQEYMDGTLHQFLSQF